MVKMAQENSAQYKREKKQASIDEANEDIRKTIETLNRTELEKIQQNFYQNSIQDTEKTKKIRIFGNLYVNKKLAKRIIVVVVAIVGSIVVGKTITSISEINEYNRVLKQKMETELTDEQIEMYHNDHANPISNIFEAYQEIDEGKDSLNPDHYNFFGDNINDPDKEYLPFDGDSFINLSEYQQDAIDIATNNVIEEYHGKGM